MLPSTKVMLRRTITFAFLVGQTCCPLAQDQPTQTQRINPGSPDNPGSIVKFAGECKGRQDAGKKCSCDPTTHICAGICDVNGGCN
jgi:hypothetical protein